MTKDKVIRYSEAFKLKVISEIEKGMYNSLGEVREKYNIGGGSTITNWLRKYGKNHLLPKHVRIEMPDEKNTIKELKKEISILKKALARANAGEVINEAYFDIFCEKFGVSEAEKAAIKKKAEERLLKEGR